MAGITLKALRSVFPGTLHSPGIRRFVAHRRHDIQDRNVRVVVTYAVSSAFLQWWVGRQTGRQVDREKEKERDSLTDRQREEI